MIKILKSIILKLLFLYECFNVDLKLPVAYVGGERYWDALTPSTQDIYHNQFCPEKKDKSVSDLKM